MPSRPTIPIIDQRNQLPHAEPVSPGRDLTDRHGRALRDLRISITDRCNFRCIYCMPKGVFGKDYPFLKRKELLNFEEITRLARIFSEHGVRKLRITGGEPLLRRGVEHLIAALAKLDGLELTLTTNGVLLPRMAERLRDAGLNRITVSLDALDEATFRRMNDVDFPVADVLSGIEAAERAGFGQIKVNMVVKRGVNDHAILDLARVTPIADEDLERETADKTSSVHFLRIELTPEMVQAVKQGAPVSMGIDHPAYNYTAEPIPQNIRDSLAGDLG